MSDKHRFTISRLCICVVARLVWWLLATVAPHYVCDRRTHYHQCCAGQTKRLQETNEHHRNHAGYDTQVGKLTNLLTPWSRVLLEKLIGSAASQEIPRIFGTRRFITVLTSARNLPLS